MTRIAALFTVVVIAAVCTSCQTSAPSGTSAGGSKTAPARQAKAVSAQPQDLESRLAEIERRLDYLTAELAIQRGDLDRVREKAGIQPEEAGK